MIKLWGGGGLVKLMSAMSFLSIRENEVDKIGRVEAYEDSESDIACGY